MNREDTVGKLKGVGEKTEKLYAKLGIYTISDLFILAFPFAYHGAKRNTPHATMQRKEEYNSSSTIFQW